MVSSKLSITLLFTLGLISSAMSLSCYSCFYDSQVDVALPNMDKDCLGSDMSGIKIEESTHKRCYAAVVKDAEGDVVSAHRGSGQAAIYQFAEAVSRQSEDFIIKFCETDLCNGSPSLDKSAMLVTSLLAVLLLVFKAY